MDTTSDSSSCHVNDRYLNTPEKIKKIDSLRRRARKAESELKKLIDKGESVNGGLEYWNAGILE